MSDEERPRAGSDETSVEVQILPEVVVVRSNRYPDEALRFTPAEWAVFLRGVKRGEFDS
jgi:hypothetical protein